MKVRLLPTETDSAPAMGLEESWLAVLGELAGISQTATQLAEFAHSAAERVRSLVGADYSLVHWWDSNRQSLRVVARSGNAGEVRSRGVGADELARSCFAQGELLTVEDLGTNGRKAASAAHGGLISVPLTLEGKAIGVLTLGSRARAWTPSRRDRELLRLIAAQIAPSMHAAKLIETSRAQAERFRVLHEVAVAAGGMLDPAALIALVVGKAAEALHGVNTTVFIWDPTSSTLEEVGHCHPDLKGAAPLRSGEGTAGTAFQTRQPKVVDDYQNWEGRLHWSHDRSTMAVPITVHDRPIGALSVGSRRLRTFGPEDVQLLSLFAAQLGPALEAARLTDERHRLSVSLREFAVAVGGQASTARLGELACLQIRNLVGADQAATLLVGSDGKRLTVVATSGHEESADAHVPLEVGKGVVGQAVSTGRTRIINDYGAWAGRIGEVPPGEDVFSVMATPLIVDREPVGVIHAVVKGPKAHFDERQVEVIELIAAQVAPGLRVARLVEELEGQSRRLQTLHEVAVVAGGVLDPNGLAELVVGRAKELTGALAGDLLWWDPLSVSLRVWDKDLGFWSKAPAEGAAGVAFSTRRPVAADANPHDWRHLVLPPGSTALAVPLLVHDQPIGSLSLLFGSGSRIPSDAVDLLTMLAAQAAPALDAARLHSDLASSEQRYRAIFDKAFICISQTDLEGRCLDMNQAGLDMLGYTEHDVPTLWWNDILAPTEHEPGNLIARLCTSARDRYRGQRLCQRQDGTPFWGDLTASVLRDPTGQPTGAYVMLEDITERREAEDMATRLGRILDASAAEILIVDPATLAITQANRTACENLGWSFGELTEMRLPQLVATLSEAEILEIMRDLESSDKDEALYVGEHLRRDGSQYPVEVRLQASEVQRPPLILVIVHDISERLREEEARRETEAKSRFLASMSHELRTPLNSILGFAQLLARPGFGGLSDRQQRYLGHIESSGRHLLELINDVLDLSRLDAGQFRVDPVTVELGPMVQELIAKVRPLAGDRHLFLDVSVEEKVMVHADPLRLSQVIWNLLSNALKFTSDRGTIKIVAGRQGKMIFMTVADNGIGIPVDQQERIFEEFTQVDSGLSRNREGAGLGLTLSRRLVIAMGGSLTVASTAGEGSAFTVRLPAASVKRPRKSPKR